MVDKVDLHFNSCLAKVEALINKDDELDSGDVITIISHAMPIVEGISDLTGEEKKRLVLKLTKTVIENHVSDEEIKKGINLTVDTIGPTAIDTIVSASRGELPINIEIIRDAAETVTDNVGCLCNLFKK